MPQSLNEERPPIDITKEKPPVLWLIYPILFLIVGLIIFSFGLKIIRKAQTSVNWPSCEGVIVLSEEARHQGGGRRGRMTTFSADIEYEFTVNDTSIRGDKINIGRFWSPFTGGATEYVNKYPKGEVVTVYYEPENPSTSVLEPGATPSSYLLSSVGVIILLITGGFLLEFARDTKRWKRNNENPFL